MSCAEATSDRVPALQVLHQAITDATAELTVRGRARTQTRPLAEEQEEARRFFTARTGEWAEARARWCDLAGVSTEWLGQCVARLALSWGAAGKPEGAPF